MARAAWILGLTGLVACGSFGSSESPAVPAGDAGADSAAPDAGSPDGSGPSGPPKKLFVIGGQTDIASSSKTYIGSIEPSGIVWRDGPPLAETRQAGCAVNLGDRIVTMGGTGPSFGLLGAVSMRPDAPSPSWAAETGPTEPRQGAACAASSGHLFVAGGGSETSSTQKKTSEHGVAGTDGSLTWSAGPDLPTPVQDAAYATVLGHLLVLGGYPCRKEIVGAAIDTNGTFGPWSAAGSLRDTVYGAGAAAVGDGVYVVGGLAGSSCSKGSDAVDWVRFDAAGKLVSTTSERVLPQARNYPGVAVVDGTLYVIGGNIGGGTPTPTNSVMSAVIAPDGSLGDWKEEARLPTPLARFALVVR